MRRSGEEMYLALTQDAHKLIAEAERHEAEARLGYHPAYSREAAEAVRAHAEANLRLRDKHFGHVEGGDGRE